MRLQQALVALLPLVVIQVKGTRIIQSNDDGWAELYVRSFHDALRAAGHDVVLSAPADNQSGRGSLDLDPVPRLRACQYTSCPAWTRRPTGRNVTSTRLNWVNSFPVTSMRYGIDIFGPQHWNGQVPELAVSGPNVGQNLFLTVPFSGTVGTAVYAAGEAGIPAIAFSGTDGTLAYDTQPVPGRSRVYAQLAMILTQKIIDTGKPYLPKDVWLNVNFPMVEGNCTDTGDFKWVLSRINPGGFSAPDVQDCGSDRLPTETEVIDAGQEHGECYISVSVGDAKDKTTASADVQMVVLDKLRGLWSCLP